MKCNFATRDTRETSESLAGPTSKMNWSVACVDQVSNFTTNLTNSRHYIFLSSFHTLTAKWKSILSLSLSLFSFFLFNSILPVFFLSCRPSPGKSVNKLGSRVSASSSPRAQWLDRLKCVVLSIHLINEKLLLFSLIEMRNWMPCQWLLNSGRWIG